MTLFDWISIGILLISGLVGFSRGAVRELVTVFAFTLASLAGVYLLPVSAPIVRDMIGVPWAATAAAVVIVFVIAYVALRLAGHLVTSHLHAQAALGALDRTIGLVFGVVRALVFLGVFYLVFNLATPPELMPRWISDAKLLPLARASAQTIQSLAPEGLKVAGGLRSALEKPVDADTARTLDPTSERAQRRARDNPDAERRATPAHKGSGYDSRSRDDLDALVEQAR